MKTILLKNLVLVVCILSTVQIFGQRLPVTNRYWVLDGIGRNLVLEEFGINKSDQAIGLSNQDILEDSNTYSTIEFGLGMRENQFININFFRPTEKGLFIFDFKRLSNQGWNDNNLFIQGNNLDLDYQRKLSSRVSAKARFSIANRNLQLNGGLVDSTYAFPSQDAGGGLISNDVNSLEGNYTRNEINSGIDLSYELYEDSVRSLDLNTSVCYHRDVNRFSDTYSNIAYFNKYPERGASNLLSDSIFINEVIGNASLIWRNQNDTVSNSSLDHYLVQAGVRGGLGEVRNNLDSWNAYRYAVYVESEFQFRRLSIDLFGNNVFLGFNQGAFHLNSKGSYRIHSDSLKHFNVKANLIISNELPEMVYYRYTSQLGKIRETPEFVRSIVGDLKLNFSGKYSNIEGGVNLRSIDNYAVMDKNMSVERISFSAVAISFQGSFSYRQFYISNYSAYQITSSDYRFSLPEVISSGSVSYNLPLFKKAITIKPGIEAVFYSDYYAMGFHPNMMTYYVQSDRKFGSYLTSNAFLSATVQTVDVSLRVENWNYDLFGQEPLVAPNYPGVPRFFQVRVKWVFKN